MKYKSGYDGKMTARGLCGPWANRGGPRRRCLKCGEYQFQMKRGAKICDACRIKKEGVAFHCWHPGRMTGGWADMHEKSY